MNDVQILDLDRMHSRRGQAIHFIGVGGCSMSGLAMMLREQGLLVTGSDLVESQNSLAVEATGIQVSIGHRAENIPENAQLVVVPVGPLALNNAEVLRANELGIPKVERPQLLAAMFNRAADAIAIAGTSGKTTTTSLIARAAQVAGMDPSVSVGTKAGRFENGVLGNWIIGNGPFVSEACEYFDGFHSLRPSVAVVTNINFDHGDFFSNIEEVEVSFQEFVNRIRPGGLLVVSEDCPRARQLLPPHDVRRVSFGYSEFADYRISVESWNAGIANFRLSSLRKPSYFVESKLPGEHNVSNLAAALTVCLELNWPTTTVDALREFTGVPRRLQYKGQAGGVRIWDDASGIAEAISTTMSAFRGLVQGARITVVLRLNSYTRVRDSFEKFSHIFTDRETIILTDIFPGRDREDFGQHARNLAAHMRSGGCDVRYIPDIAGRPNCEEIFVTLDSHLRSGDNVIIIGPGDIASLASDYAQHRRAQ